MQSELALSMPGPFELLLILVLFALPIVVLTVAILALHRSRRTQSAFPVIPTAQLDGPGRYRVVGVDKNSRQDRDIVVDAQSADNARVKAELDGVIVTRVTKESH